MKRGTELGSNGRNLTSLFLAVFALGIVTVISQGLLEEYLPRFLFEHRISLLNVMTIIGAFGWITTVLVLLGIYWVGKKHEINFKTPLRPVLLVLLGGAYGGHSVGKFVLFLTIDPPAFLSLALLNLIPFPGFLFTAFTALFLAHLRSPQLEGIMQRGTETEPQGQNRILLFLAVFVLGGITTGVSLWWGMIYFPNFILNQEDLTPITSLVYFRIASVTISLITTVLVLLGMYWVGKNREINFKTPLRPVLPALLGGAYGGYSVGIIVITLAIFPTEPFLQVIRGILPAILVSPPSLFFPAFTALSLAHLKAR